MTTPVTVQVRHTPTDTQGRPRPNTDVAVKLRNGGWVAQTQTRIDQSAVRRTDPTGLLVMQLVPQSLIDPAGTHYEIRDFDGTIQSFVVPDGTPTRTGPDGPFWWVRDLLVANPATPSPVVIGTTPAQLAAAIVQAAADATSKANTARDAAISASAVDASTKAATAQTAAIAAAALDATVKAAAAQAAAQAFATGAANAAQTAAAADATSKANAVAAQLSNYQPLGMDAGEVA